MKAVCIKHPKYDGNMAPMLTCQACCVLFLAIIKENKEELKKSNG